MEELVVIELTIILVLQIIFHFKLNKIKMKQEELATALTEVTATVGKIKAEVTVTLEKVTALEEALANAGEVTPEVQIAFDALKASVTTVDELIVDTPVEPPVETKL